VAPFKLKPYFTLIHSNSLIISCCCSFPCNPSIHTYKCTHTHTHTHTQTLALTHTPMLNRSASASACSVASVVLLRLMLRRDSARAPLAALPRDVPPTSLICTGHEERGGVIDTYCFCVDVWQGFFPCLVLKYGYGKPSTLYVCPKPAALRAHFRYRMLTFVYGKPSTHFVSQG